MMRYQLIAYGTVLLIWVVPIPNPIKLLAVSFHELSHALVALATGGRVFGYAITPNGAGVTMGVGGYFPVILIAGYIGSCVWGIILYYVSIRWRPKYALFFLVFVVFFSAAFGWLNSQTAFFGVGSLVMMGALFATADPVQIFFVRLVGSACVLFAPLEVMGEVVQLGGAPAVMGMETMSDVAQLASLSGVHPLFVSVVLVGMQLGLLYILIRWTAEAGSRACLHEEAAGKREIKERLRDLHPEDRVYRLR